LITCGDCQVLVRAVWNEAPSSGEPTGSQSWPAPSEPLVPGQGLKVERSPRNFGDTTALAGKGDVALDDDDTALTLLFRQSGNPAQIIDSWEKFEQISHLDKGMIAILPVNVSRHVWP